MSMTISSPVRYRSLELLVHAAFDSRCDIKRMQAHGLGYNVETLTLSV